jgi:hypothetical protein
VFSECSDAADFRELLSRCEAVGSEFYADGLRLNTYGITQAVAVLESTVKRYTLDAVVGDSCLCATEAKWMDYDGAVLQP